jgi:lipase chaperone LimK
MKMDRQKDIFEGRKKYIEAEKSLTEYMKYLSRFDTERAYKVEKLRDRVMKI